MIKSKSKDSSHHIPSAIPRSLDMNMDDFSLSDALTEISLKENLNFIREIDDILSNKANLSKNQVEHFCNEQRRFIKQYLVLLAKKNDK